jgi:hypothetical protein
MALVPVALIFLSLMGACKAAHDEKDYQPKENFQEEGDFGPREEADEDAAAAKEIDALVETLRLYQSPDLGGLGLAAGGDEIKVDREMVAKDLKDVEGGIQQINNENFTYFFHSEAFKGMKEEVRAAEQGTPQKDSWFQIFKGPEGTQEAQTTILGTSIFLGLAAYNLGFAYFDLVKAQKYGKVTNKKGDFDRKGFSKVAYGRAAIGFGLGLGMLSLAYAGHNGIFTKEDFDTFEGTMAVIDGTTIAMVGAYGMYEATRVGEGKSYDGLINSPGKAQKAKFSDYYVSKDKSLYVKDGSDYYKIQDNAGKFIDAPEKAPTPPTDLKPAHSVLGNAPVVKNWNKNFTFKVGMGGLIGFGMFYTGVGTYKIVNAKTHPEDPAQPTPGLSLASDPAAPQGLADGAYFRKITQHFDRLFAIHDRLYP